MLDRRPIPSRHPSEHAMKRSPRRTAWIHGPLVILSVLFLGCVSFQPHVRGTPAPPLPDGPLNPRGSTPPPAGTRVQVRYLVSCSRCEIQFTDAYGETSEVEAGVGGWRHREDIPVSVRSVTLSVLPKEEDDRVRSVRILLDGKEVAVAPILAGGTSELVVLNASLAGEISGPVP